MPIKLSKETRERLGASIQRYFERELEHEIGTLGAQLLLDYVLAEIGPSVYNQAIMDAQQYFQERTMDLDGSCYEPEMTFWNKR